MKTLLQSLFLVGFFATTQAHAQQVCYALFQYTIGNCPNVTFVDYSTSGSGVAQVVSWSYDFGDGSSANTPNTNHTYTSNGNYQVCLTIVTSDSCVDTYCDSVSINCITGTWCQAAFQYTLGNCPSVSFFDGSSANPGTIVSWDWDFGDGSTANTASPTNVYSVDGAYNVCLTIVTSDSCSSTYCDSVVIDCILGIDEFGLDNAVISPNPVNDVLRLTLNEASALNYRIIGLSGVVHREDALPVVKEHSVDVNALPKGFYLLEMEINGVRTIKRFLKK
jgi:chitodextrinase